jgi:hypothetical protein
MEKLPIYSLPKTTKISLNQVVKTVANLDDDRLKQVNVKGWSVNQPFSDQHLLNVLHELAKV